MKPNRVRQVWAEGGCALNAFLSMPCPFAAEIMAAQGYDALTVDIQHGVVDYQTTVGMFQAMQVATSAPMARVDWLDPAAVMKVLDAGAYGLICPMVNTPEDAARLVSYTRYPPTGIRSFGPGRAAFSAGADYAERFEDEILVFAMIETAEAMENLEAIAATPGLDALYIGPADLTLAMTGRTHRTGFDREEPEIINAIQRILAAAHAAGIRAALHCGTAEYALRAKAWGFDLVTVSNDVRLMAGAAAASVATFRKGAAAPSDARSY
jgi:4-hydroxy-2-oxoheptanedioate aldolase